MTAIHFTVAISQNSETVLNGLTLYGPVVLTASVYVMSLLFAHRGVMDGASGGALEGEGPASINLGDLTNALTS